MARAIFFLFLYIFQGRYTEYKIKLKLKKITSVTYTEINVCKLVEETFTFEQMKEAGIVGENSS